MEAMAVRERKTERVSDFFFFFWVYFGFQF